MDEKYATTDHGHGLRAAERGHHALSVRLGSKADERRMREGWTIVQTGSTADGARRIRSTPSGRGEGTVGKTKTER